MSEHELYLLTSRRFLPLFITQFFGAFNDNLFKNAIAALITFKLASQLEFSSQLLVTAAGGIFILPFFLFSATAGQLAEIIEKSRLIQYTKILEISLAILGAIGFIFSNIWFLFAVLFLLGAQSTFFGPLKYSILPDHLREDELIGGNGLIGMGTFVSILIGTIAGNLLINVPYGEGIISIVMLSLAVAGWLASRFIPQSLPDSAGLKLNLNPVSETWRIIQHASKHRQVFVPMLAISWFWLVGATYLTQFFSFGKNIIGGNEQVVTLFLTSFTLGIAVGAMACNRLVKGVITAKYVPLGALGMTAFGIDLFLASHNMLPPSNQLMGAIEFLSSATYWRILADLTLFSICGGLYIVPLYSLIQNRSQKEHRSRNIACLNILNALFMVISAVVAFIMLDAGCNVPQIFLSLAIVNSLVAIGLYFYYRRQGNN
ncbi:MAG: MFS transporter [Gammaproteobacteria bacterium]|nr:MFS transporter [Gammaproteobacteria bacterium]